MTRPCLALALLLFSSGVSPEPRHSVVGILTPGETAPAAPGGGLLQVDIRLRLPLTPPPGVQQPAALEGWRVVLERRDLLTPDGARHAARYELPVMRLRPAGSGEVYRLSVELVPWLLPGRYDLIVEGPGFSDLAEGAVIVGPAATASPEIGIAGRAGMSFALSNPSPRPVEFALHLALPDELPGISLRAGGAEQAPTAASFLSMTKRSGGQGRVLVYDLRIPGREGDTDGLLPVALTKRAAATCASEIVWTKADEPRETMAWRDLSWRAPRPPVTVIWRFGDGRWGVGRKVRHRWLLQNEATVSAVSIDELGRTCDATSRYRLNPLTRGSGCSCAVIGR